MMTRVRSVNRLLFARTAMARQIQRLSVVSLQGQVVG
jgi:hypothetical protein